MSCRNILQCHHWLFFMQKLCYREVLLPWIDIVFELSGKHLRNERRRFLCLPPMSGRHSICCRQSIVQVLSG